MKANHIAIKVFIARKGWTASNLACASGVSRQTISAILHGKDCNPTTLGKIAKALNVDVTDILGGLNDA